MKRKFVILGDLHLDANLRGFDYFSDVCSAMTQVLQTVKKGDVVIQLGDVCDPDKGARTFRALSTLAQWRDEIHKLGAELFVLAGNHDVIDDSRCIGSRAVFASTIGPGAVTHPTIHSFLDQVVVFLPWVSRAHVPNPQEEMLNTFAQANSSGDPVIVFCHLDLPGVMPGGEADMPRMGRLELPQSILEHEQVSHVFAGHIHKPGVYGKLNVVGSLARLGHGEAADTKGFSTLEFS